MADRIFMESILASESLNKLTASQERFFFRLILACDDDGYIDARPKVLASKLFPLKRDVRESQINDILRALYSAELISVFKKDGKDFIRPTTWDRYQNPCKPEEKKLGRKKQPAQEREEAADEPARYMIPLIDGTEFGVTNSMIEQYRKLYLAIDVEEEIRKMVGWCLSNPRNRTTRSGVKRFMNGWFSRAQDKAKRTGEGQNSTVYIPNPGLEDWT